MITKLSDTNKNEKFERKKLQNFEFDDWQIFSIHFFLTKIHSKQHN